MPRNERYNRLNVLDEFVASPLAGPAGLPNLKGRLRFVGVNGASRRQYDTPYNNVAPRFGFAYQASRNTVIRGGFGMFYAPSYRVAAGTVSNTGYRADTTYAGTLDGVTPYSYLRNPFPTDFAPVSGNSQDLLTAVGTTTTVELPNDNITAYSENWSFNIQRQLPGNLLVETSYVVSHGVHLNQSGETDVNLNQLSPAQLALGTQLQQQVPNPFYGLITSGTRSGKTIPYSFLLRPFPQFTGITGV